MSTYGRQDVYRDDLEVNDAQHSDLDIPGIARCRASGGMVEIVHYRAATDRTEVNVVKPDWTSRILSIIAIAIGIAGLAISAVKLLNR